MNTQVSDTDMTENGGQRWLNEQKVTLKCLYFNLDVFHPTIKVIISLE